MRSFVLLCRSIANVWRSEMGKNKLPIDIDSQLRELGVLPPDYFDEIDASDLHRDMAGKRSFSVDYNTPLFDEDGEPDF